VKPKYGSEMAQESIPLKYVDSLSDKKHLVLLYDDEEYAQRIEFEFLKKGLMTGDSCIYATEMDPGLVILKMINSGIPVRHFLKKNLQVYQIPRLIDETEIMIKYARKLFKKILESASPPYRIVARIVADIGTPEGILAEMKLEREFHSNFSTFDGYIVCPYDISKLRVHRENKWIQYLFETHHATIYALKSNQGGAFYLQ